MSNASILLNEPDGRKAKTCLEKLCGFALIFIASCPSGVSV